jgi:HEAT repeat protein
MEDGGYVTRKAAAAQLAERWPPAAEFTVDAPAERRGEMLAALRKTWGESHVLADYVAANPLRGAAEGDAESISPERLEKAREIVRRLQEAPPTGGAISWALRDLDEFGPDLVPALARLVADERAVLPDVVYREVLAKRGAEFDALDRLAAATPLERRQAAGKLAEQARQRPLSGLALARLAELGVGEDDVLVWHSLMQAVANDPREPSIRLAYAGMSHSSGEVRRMACEHLATFRDPRHAAQFLPALEDQQRSVVLAAVNGLGHPGMMADVRPLERLLGTNDRELRLSAAESLVRLGAPSGVLAMERLAHDADPQTRRDAAAVMGVLGNPAFVDVLVGMLDDGLGVQFIALESLPKVAGRDVADDPANPATDTLERISRWKRWHDAERRKAEAGPAVSTTGGQASAQTSVGTPSPN